MASPLRRPGSGLSWRLRRVQAHLVDALEAHPGPCRIVSACSGDSRDVLEVLAGRDDADRARAVLVELHPGIADRARAKAAAAGLPRVEVRIVDAGTTDAYAGAVPAHIVLMVGIFGNISDDDLWRTIEAAPQLCAPGASLVWSRGKDDPRSERRGSPLIRVCRHVMANGCPPTAEDTR